MLSKELQKEFPGAKGYSAANLWRMRNFYLTYRDSEKLAPMVREISWSNNVIIMEKCKDDLQREFYIQMTKRYGWTKRVLTNFVEARTYEKYLTNQTNFDLTLPEGRRTQAKLAVKDEYTFDFAELSPEYSEHELEMQLVNNIRAFLIEMGGDFTFIGNQYHLVVGNRDLAEENDKKTNGLRHIEFQLQEGNCHPRSLEEAIINVNRNLFGQSDDETEITFSDDDGKKTDFAIRLLVEPEFVDYEIPSYIKKV